MSPIVSPSGSTRSWNSSPSMSRTVTGTWRISTSKSSSPSLMPRSCAVSPLLGSSSPSRFKTCRGASSPVLAWILRLMSSAVSLGLISTGTRELSGILTLTVMIFGSTWRLSPSCNPISLAVRPSGSSLPSFFKDCLPASIPVFFSILRLMSLAVSLGLISTATFDPSGMSTWTVMIFGSTCRLSPFVIPISLAARPSGNSLPPFLSTCFGTGMPVLSSIFCLISSEESDNLTSIGTLDPSGMSTMTCISLGSTVKLSPSPNPMSRAVWPPPSGSSFPFCLTTCSSAGSPLAAAILSLMSAAVSSGVISTGTLSPLGMLAMTVMLLGSKSKTVFFLTP
mmetsp:Transcript_25043/g.69273  ORF Transcript_25043/g.69273 Transcript_25043/m.69273 type:complete len:338 (-) Transcript_25043:1500-2513(-)